MTNDAEPSQPRGVSLELAHEMRRDKAIIDLQEQVRKLTNLGGLMSTPLTLPTLFCMRTMRIEVSRKRSSKR